MINPPQQPKIFGDLTYASPIQTYVGSPLNEVDQLGSHLEAKYNNNLANMDSIYAKIKNIPVRDVNNPIIQNKVNQVTSQLDSFTEKGNYEDADGTVRKIARDFANDPEIKGAIQDKQMYDAWIEDLDKKVQSKIISQADRDDAIRISKYANQNSTSYDPDLMKYNNMWEGVNPPPFVDINEKVLKIVDKIPANTTVAALKQDGIIPYDYQEDENTVLSKEKLESVVRNFVTSSPEVVNYLQWKSKVDDFNNRAELDNITGKIKLRDYNLQDLKNSGILDKDGKKYIPVANNEGNIIFKDADGKEFSNINEISPDGYLVNPETDSYVVKDGKRVKLEPIMREDKDFYNNLYTPYGEINQDYASKVMSAYDMMGKVDDIADFGKSFSYSKTNRKHITDDYRKSLALQNNKASLDLQVYSKQKLIDAMNEGKSPGEEESDYDRTFLKWAFGQTEKEASPEMIKHLLGDKVSGSGGIVIPEFAGKLKNSDNEEISSSHFSNEEYAVLPTTAAAEKDYNERLAKFTMNGNDLVPTHGKTREAMLKEFKENLQIQVAKDYKIPIRFLKSYIAADISENDKKTLDFAAKYLNNTPISTNYKPMSGNNVKRINGKVYTGIEIEYGDNELGNSLNLPKDIGFKDLKRLYPSIFTNVDSETSVDDLDTHGKINKRTKLNVWIPVPDGESSRLLWDNKLGLKKVSRESYGNNKLVAQEQAIYENYVDEINSYDIPKNTSQENRTKIITLKAILKSLGQKETFTKTQQDYLKSIGLGRFDSDGDKKYETGMEVLKNLMEAYPKAKDLIYMAL